RAVGEGLERDVVAVLRHRGTIPRSVERDEQAAAILGRELRAAVEHQIERRPVRGKADDRRGELRAAAGLLAVSTVFRIEQQLLLSVIEEAVRPAEVRS